jgi:DNA-binding GntR family transcriptional regulator
MASATAPSGEILKAVPLTEQVTAILKDRILRGDLRSGERIVEQQLARNLGVGQNVIREALIALAHRGFVRRVANRGTYVTKLTLREAHKLGEVRAELECLAVRLITRRMRQDVMNWAPFDEMLECMRKAAESGDREKFYDCDINFHRMLWALADNEHLSQMLEQIVVPLFAFFIMLYMRQNGATESLVESVAAHEKLISALKHSGGEAAVEAMREIVDLSLKHQQGLIAEQG